MTSTTGNFTFLILALILGLIPLIALARIWMYSKQQLDELRRIRDHLELKM